jgi:nucleoside-diphosphate-sugar epimerase
LAVSDAPISPYAFTKKACELVLYNFFHLYKVSSICLRFFTVYGPRQRPDLAINKFFTAIQSGKQIDIYGDGSMARDYTFIADTVDGIMAALDHIINNDPVFEVVNLGNSKPFTILALVHAIEQVTGVKANLNFTQEQPGDVQVTCADIVKAGQLLGYNPKVKLLEGLEKYYQWTLNEQTKHAEATR